MRIGRILNQVGRILVLNLLNLVRSNHLKFSTMKVIWYNTENEHYQSGSWGDYTSLKESSQNPDNILVLERFHHESMNVLAKIVRELNKCTKTSKTPR